MHNWQPEHEAPKNVPVIVNGGTAMKKEDGCWYTGMEEPLFQRPIEWEVKGWMPLPYYSSLNVPDGKDDRISDFDYRCEHKGEK